MERLDVSIQPKHAHDLLLQLSFHLLSIKVIQVIAVMSKITLASSQEIRGDSKLVARLLVFDERVKDCKVFFFIYGNVLFLLLGSFFCAAHHVGDPKRAREGSVLSVEEVWRNEEEPKRPNGDLPHEIHGCIHLKRKVERGRDLQPTRNVVVSTLTRHTTF